MLIAGIITILLVMILLWLLQWRSNLKPRAFEDLFIVKRSEPLTISQENGAYIIRWEDNTQKPTSIFTGISPETTNHTVKMTQVEDGCATLADIEPHPRPFFKINSVASKGSVFGERLLPMDKIINFRDLGGYETIDGKRVQWGKVFRSANLGRSSENDLNFLKSLGIRLVCDLRLAKEMAKRPDRLPEGVRFLHIPAAEEDPVNAKKILFNSQHLEDIFLHGYYKSQLIDDGAKVFGRLIKLVSNTANLPLVLHCNAGKDRAGIAAALILLAIGVPEKTVVEDYTLSNLNVEYMLRSVAHNYRHMRWFRLRVEHFYPLIATPPRMMENSIKHIHERYGSIERYLLNAAGLENQDLRNLRQNLLEA